MRVSSLLAPLGAPLRERRCLSCAIPVPAPSVENKAVGGEEKIVLCGECRGKLIRRADGYCARCGSLSQTPHVPPSLCGTCLGGTQPWERFFFHGAYQGLLRDLILRFKNSRELSLSRLLGSFFVNHPAITGPYDAVVPIPLHPKRLRDRGFNQAVELAKILAAHLDTRLLSGGIARSVDTHPQAGLSRQERSRNVLGIFTASPEAAEKKLLLVDDVATTCATVRSATLALLDAGASSVDIAVLARTPGDSSLI